MNSRNLLILVAAIGLLLNTSTVLAAKNVSLDRAREAARSGDWETAAEYAQKAAEENPKDADVWTMLARAELFLGDTASAREHYEVAVERNPRHAEAVLELTSLYVREKKLDDADRVVGAAEAKDSRGKIDEIKVARALILGAQGKIGEATPILASVSGKHPDNPLYPKMLARIYENAGVNELAATNYDKAWQLDEGDAELAFEYGQVLLKLKRYDEANRLFSIVQERDPENKIVDYLRGRLLHAAGRFAEATTELEKAIQKRPDDFLSNYWLGRAYLDFSISTGKNAYGLAVAPLTKALELRPDREDVAAELGNAIYEQGIFYYRLSNQDTTEEYKNEQLHESLVYFHEALGYDADFGDIYSYMARVHDRLNDLDSALYYTDLQLDAAFAKAAAKLSGTPIPRPPQPPQPSQGDEVPEVPPAPQAVDSAQLKLTVAKDNMSDVTRKISLLQRMSNQTGLVELLDPLMSDEMIFERYGMILANAYIETRQYAEAREMMSRMIVKDPTDCDLHQLNAYIDLKQERYGAAINALLEGVKACPKNPDLWVYLGDSYYFSNEKDKATVQKARDAYKKACDLGDRTGCEKHEQITQILATWR